MPDPQIKVTVLDRWPIIVEFMGGPRDGECRHYAKAPPFVLLFQRGVRLVPNGDSCHMHYERYEMDSGQTGSRLRYHYIGKDRVEFKPSSGDQPHAARG